MRRLLAFLAMALGLLGIVACALGGYGVWSVGARLNRANERAFGAIDEGLVAARERVVGVQGRVADYKGATDTIAKLARGRAGQRALESVAARLDLESKADNLAQRLGQADAVLDAAGEAVEGVKQVLETADTLGVQANGAVVDEVFENLTKLRGMVQQAQATAAEVRDVAAKLDEPGSREERWAQVGRLLARVLAALTDVDTRLATAADRLAGARPRMTEREAETKRYIDAGTVAGLLLLAWVAAGQVALFVSGWKIRRSAEAV
jgi:hypothetical protein